MPVRSTQKTGARSPHGRAYGSGGSVFVRFLWRLSLLDPLVAQAYEKRLSSGQKGGPRYRVKRRFAVSDSDLFDRERESQFAKEFASRLDQSVTTSGVPPDVLVLT